MKFLTPLGGALALIAGGASAWGPLSHMTFNCQAFFPSLTVAECLQQNPTFGVASDIPDTFGFGAFNITDDADYLCKNLTYVHDPVFGGEMTLLAMDERRRGVAGNGSFDAMALAVAFTGHIMGDLVGCVKKKTKKNKTKKQKKNHTFRARPEVETLLLSPILFDCKKTSTPKPIPNHMQF
jgi:hypothetical protein